MVICFLAEGLRYCENYQNVTQRQRVMLEMLSDVPGAVGKNGAKRLARCRVTTNLSSKEMQHPQSTIKRGGLVFHISYNP